MILAIIQARMGSTRLPGKVLTQLHGKPVLWHVISRVRKSKLIDRFVVATTTSPEDDPIEEFCAHEGIAVCRGSRDDVLDRFYQCAVRFKADTIVRITADCPLHDASVIDYVISEYLEGSLDYVSNTLKYTYPDGLDVEVFSIISLEDAWNNACLDSEREHVTPYIRNNPAFRKKNVVSLKRYPLYRMTLDTPEDLEFISRIYSGMGTDDFGLDDVVQYLEEHTELTGINQHLGLNEGYIKSLVQDAIKEMIHGKLIFLKKIDANDILQHENNKITSDNTVAESYRRNVSRLVNDLLLKPDTIVKGVFYRGKTRLVGIIVIRDINYSKKTGILNIFTLDDDTIVKEYINEARVVFKEYVENKVTINITEREYSFRDNNRGEA